MLQNGRNSVPLERLGDEKPRIVIYYLQGMSSVFCRFIIATRHPRELKIPMEQQPEKTPRLQLLHSSFMRVPIGLCGDSPVLRQYRSNSVGSGSRIFHESDSGSRDS